MDRERAERAAAQEKLRKEQQEESKRLEEERKKQVESEKQQKEQEDARKKETERKRQEEERKKKAALEKQRKEQEDTRKKETERKRQEEERHNLTLAEQAERQKRIEDERYILAKTNLSLTKRRQELAAQPSPPGLLSPQSLSLATSASPTVESASSVTAVAREAASLGIFAAKPPAYQSPRPGSTLQSSSPSTPQAETEEQKTLRLAASTQSVRDIDHRRARVLSANTVEWGLSSYSEKPNATDARLTDPTASVTTPPAPVPPPVLKPPGSQSAKK